MHHKTLQIFTVSKYFYHHFITYGRHFPKASQVDFTNNSILRQFFIFSYAWYNFPKPQLWWVHKFYFKVYLDKLRPWLSRQNNTLQYPHVLREFSSIKHLWWAFYSTKCLCHVHFIQQRILFTKEFYSTKNQDHFHLLELLSLCLAGIFLQQCKYG